MFHYIDILNQSIQVGIDIHHDDYKHHFHYIGHLLGISLDFLNQDMSLNLSICPLDIIDYYCIGNEVLDIIT